DVFINGQRQLQTKPSGGPFSLVLPPGAAGSPTSVVVTDVTGRNIILPLEVAPVDARLLRGGTFLWSAGAGAPRFSYGSLSADYLVQPYGFANARYGVADSLALSLHSEGGRRLMEGEAGSDFAATPWLSSHTSLAGSRSDRGAGAFASAGLTLRGPCGLSFDGQGSRGIGRSDEVVPVSGQKQPGGTYADAAAEIRTGYGIPGVEVNSFAGQTTAYAKARGSVGLLEWHPFISDPVRGGLILADGGAPGMPVQLNGYNK